MIANLSDDGILGNYVLKGDSNYYDGGTGVVKARYWGNSLIPVTGGDYLMVGSGFENSNGPHRQVTFISKVGTPAVGIKDLLTEELEINIYPNPASDFLNIRLENPDHNCTLIMRDMTGRVYRLGEHIAGPRTQIDISNLASGIYFLEIGTMEKIVARRKIVIQ